jgi:hypothetical protein
MWRSGVGRAALAAVAGAVAMVLFVAVAAPANASTVMTPTLGKRWKSGTTVKVYSSLPSVFNKSLTAALRDLNGSGAHIHLKRVTKKRGAKVVLVLKNVPGADGNTAPRSKRLGSLTVIHISPRVVPGYGLKRRPYAAGLLLAHELSHSLGLAHNYGHCSVVGSFWDMCKTAESSTSFTCRFLQKRDKERLVNLYGGKVSAPAPVRCSIKSGKPFVPVDPIVGAAVTFVPGPPGGSPPLTAVATWSPNPAITMFLELYDGTCGSPHSYTYIPAAAAFGSLVDGAAGTYSGVDLSQYPDEGLHEVCMVFIPLGKTDGAVGPASVVNASFTVLSSG